MQIVFYVLSACIFLAGTKVVWSVYRRPLRCSTSVLFLLSFVVIGIADYCLTLFYGRVFEPLGVGIGIGLILAGFAFMLLPALNFILYG